MLASRRWLPRLKRGRRRLRRFGRHRSSGGRGGGAGIGDGGRGDALTARAHGEGGGREGLAGVGRDDGGRAHFEGAELLDLPLQPLVLLRQRSEPPL